MKTIKYTVEIKFVEKGKEIKLITYASNEKELVENAKVLMSTEKKSLLSFFK